MLGLQVVVFSAAACCISKIKTIPTKITKSEILRLYGQQALSQMIIIIFPFDFEHKHTSKNSIHIIITGYYHRQKDTCNFLISTFQSMYTTNQGRRSRLKSTSGTRPLSLLESFRDIFLQHSLETRQKNNQCHGTWDWLDRRQ